MVSKVLFQLLIGIIPRCLADAHDEQNFNHVISNSRMEIGSEIGDSFFALPFPFSSYSSSVTDKKGDNNGYTYHYWKKKSVSCLSHKPLPRRSPYFLSYCDVAYEYEKIGPTDDDKSFSCPCSSKGLIWCNCSSLALSIVPKDLPPQVEVLTLENNSLTEIHNGTFKIYPNLKNLVLVKNKIRSIEINGFQGLAKLVKLDLYSNMLATKEETYSVGIFRPLKSLQGLRLNRNNPIVLDKTLNYPNEALSDLKTLVYLAMDGLTNKTFGPGFQKITSLKTLYLAGYIDGYCDIVSLYSNTFIHFPSLQVLNISSCGIYGEYVSKNTFKPMTELKILDISWNDRIGFKGLTDIMQGSLRNSNIIGLHVSRMENRFSPGTIVDKVLAENLPRNLTSLTASLNSVIEVQPDVFSSLPKTLKYLDFSGNKLVFGRYLHNLSAMESLEVFSLSGDLHVYNIPKYYPTANGASFNALEQHFQDNSPKSTWHTSFILPLPPKVRVISMDNAGLRYLMTELHINPHNSLEILYLSYNYLPLLAGPITGLRKLTHLYMNNSCVYLLHQAFFDGFVSLQYLDLAYNNIGIGKWGLLNPTFENLKNLTFLDLSSNSISILAVDVFKGLDNLKELRLRGNVFWTFEPTIANLKNLKWLGLSRTSLRALSQMTMNQIDSIPSVKVDMQDTPISCTCDTTYFLDWLIKSPAIYRGRGAYLCMKDKFRARLSWDIFEERVHLLQGECTSHYWTFVGILVATFALITAAVSLVVYRFRWRIRYFYYALKINLNEKRNPKSSDHPFDVFIVYADEDEDFVLGSVARELEARNLKVMIHGRDFIAGEYIPTNILMAVRKSSKTLVILTQSLLASKWCRCEFQIANEEAMLTGRRILTFLLKDRIPKNKLGLDLLRYIQTNTYVPYPMVNDHDNDLQNNPQMELFWNKLVHDLLE